MYMNCGVNVLFSCWFPYSESSSGANKSTEEEESVQFIYILFFFAIGKGIIKQKRSSWMPNYSCLRGWNARSS
jgi:hypothetical protein